MRYAFWNNKGGTGKTSLAFQTISEYAIQNPSKKILAIDLCPQSNLTELFMGGLLGDGGKNLEKLTSNSPSTSIGGYFEKRLSTPYQIPEIEETKYISNPHNINENIPRNVDLIAGDKIIELQSNSISALSITQVPGVNTFIKIIDWVNDLLDVIQKETTYDDIFIDTNPSFAIYTQIALAASERIIVPVMADDSSRRALLNVFSLIYGLNLPSSIYKDYAFNAKMSEAGKSIPKIHTIVKNRLTQYMGPASAYANVLSSIDDDISSIISSDPDYFNFSNIDDGVVNVRDFGTTGVVSFAEATPFLYLKTGVHHIFNKETQVQKEYLDNCKDSINEITEKL